MFIRIASILFVSMIATTGCATEVGEDGDGDGAGDGTGDGTGGSGGTGGGSGGGGGGMTGEMTPASFLAAIGKKECDDAHACKATFPSDAGVTHAEAFGSSPSACYPMAAEYYDASAVQSSISAGKITWDAASASACVAGFPGAPTCGSYWDQGPNMPAACGTALVGKVATGGACTNDFECAGQNYCESSKCIAPPSGARTSPEEGLAVRPKARLAGS